MQVTFTDSCPMEKNARRTFHVRAKCPPMKCGFIRNNIQNSPRLQFRQANERKKRDEYLRIVGGDRSGPNSWPYIVAMYKDGRFHCGGTIISQYWVSFTQFLT